MINRAKALGALLAPVLVLAAVALALSKFPSRPDANVKSTTADKDSDDSYSVSVEKRFVPESEILVPGSATRTRSATGMREVTTYTFIPAI